MKHWRRIIKAYISYEPCEPYRLRVAFDPGVIPLEWTDVGAAFKRGYLFLRAEKRCWILQRRSDGVTIAGIAGPVRESVARYFSRETARDRARVYTCKAEWVRDESYGELLCVNLDSICL